MKSLWDFLGKFMGFSNWPWNASNAIGRDMNLLYYKNVFCKLFNMIIISGQPKKTETNFCAELKHFSHGWCFNMHKNVENFKSSSSGIVNKPSAQDAKKLGGGDELSHQFARKQKSFKKPIKKLTLVLNCFLLQLLRIRVSEERETVPFTTVAL